IVGRVHAAGCAFIALAFALLVVSPHVSAYLLLLSWPAFGQCCAFVLAPRLWMSGLYLVREWEAGRRRGPFTMAAASAAIVLVVYGAIVVRHMRIDYGGNYSGFIQLSRARFDSDPMLTDRSDVRDSLILWNNGGYDSQFMYFEMYDPFLRRYGDRPAMYS